MGTMVVHRQPPRKTDEEKEGRKGEEEGKGEVENCGGRRDACEGKKGGLRASAPPRKWRHKRPHGREAPSLDAGDGPGDGGGGGREDRGKNGLREGKGRGVATRRGCKCPRDVSDRCGSTHPPSSSQTPSPCPLTTRPKNVLRMESG